MKNHDSNASCEPKWTMEIPSIRVTAVITQSWVHHLQQCWKFARNTQSKWRTGGANEKNYTQFEESVVTDSELIAIKHANRRNVDFGSVPAGNLFIHFRSLAFQSNPEKKNRIFFGRLLTKNNENSSYHLFR